jgi:hypothetical protein
VMMRIVAALVAIAPDAIRVSRGEAPAFDAERVEASAPKGAQFRLVNRN